MIRIDPEFKSLIPPLTDEEYDGLRDSLLYEGCRDALVVWDGVLVDGHNRYEICEKHGIPYDTIEMEFANRDEAMLWMINNQKARRNLSSFARGTLESKAIEILSRQANQKQRDAGGDRRSQAYKEKTALCDFTQSDQPKIDVKKELAKRADIGEQTASRVIQINKAIDKAIEEETTIAGQKPEELKSKLMSGEMSINQGYQTIKNPHVSFNSGNNEWYTPEIFIESSREVMGSIDLDPATSEIAQKVVKAKTYYTAETNGLDKSWTGNVWMNPPYSSDLIGNFVDKLIAERDNYQQAIVLVNNATETEWFNKIISIASAVCFPKSRVKFYMPDGKTGAPLQGQAIIYIGGNKEKFLDVFSFHGWCAVVYGIYAK